MNIREIGNFLKDTLDLQKELIEFGESCLIKLYGDDSKFAIARFHEDIDSGMNWNGCIQNVQRIDKEVEEMRENRKKHLAKMQTE